MPGNRGTLSVCKTRNVRIINCKYLSTDTGPTRISSALAGLDAGIFLALQAASTQSRAVAEVASTQAIAH
jgi:hypothetical protein